MALNAWTTTRTAHAADRFSNMINAEHDVAAYLRNRLHERDSRASWWLRTLRWLLLFRTGRRAA